MNIYRLSRLPGKLSLLEFRIHNFPLIEGLSNWEILRSIKLTVEVFPITLSFPHPTPLSVCLSSRQGLNPDELQKVLDWLFSLLFKESRQNHRS